MKNLFPLLLSVLCLGNLQAQADRSEAKSYPPMVSQGQYLGRIPALRDQVQALELTAEKPGKLYEKKNYFSANELNNPNPLPQNGDPLAHPKTAAERGGNGPEIIPGFNFEGMDDNSGIAPPDPTGDIGKDHYVQMVNASGGARIQIWDKSTGELVFGPAPSSIFWGSFNLPTLGDPIVQYDHDAERWLVLEIQANGNNPLASKQLFLAVSETSDPTGEWNAYLFQTLGFPDYPKFVVWNNAYLLTVNEIVGGNKSAGYALDRNAILNNEPTFGLYRFELPNYQSIFFQPGTSADWEGGPPPPAGSPGYIFRVYDDAWEGGQDQIQYWEVFIDWTNTAMSHVDGPVKLYPSPFETKVCFGNTLFDCIEQPGAGSLRVTAFENNFMYRAPYLNFGTHESIVLNHVVDVSGQVGDGGDAAVRWYELRKNGSGDWQLRQEGTYAPDLQTNRITGTISMDEAGNIGLGYTGMSQFLYPGLYLTGQRAGDPLGEMTLEEHTLAAGGASHTSVRWGDYSSMAVDPYDGRTFWFTGQYQPNDDIVWSTRIGSFKVQRDTFDIKPELLTAPFESALLGNSEQVKVKIINNGLAPATNFSVSLYFENGFVTTEQVTDTVHVGSFLEHTFTPTVAMPTPGATYRFRCITNWNRDQFSRNDTLDATVLKLTSNDASLAGKHNLPGLVCGTSTEFGLILKNASGVPMESAQITWRINTQNWQTIDWTGNLEPGERDTIEVVATNVLNGLNGLKAYTTLPNGIQDEKINNDTISVKFFGNTDGTYLSVESETEQGILHWELRTQTNSLLAMGDVSAQQPDARICADDNQCYKILLRAGNFSWNGHFVLKNIFGDVLLEITEATTSDQVFTVCTPVRQNIDFGPLALLAPTTSGSLGAAEPVQLELRNFGLLAQSNVEVSYRMNGGAWVTEVLAGPFSPSQTIVHTFATTEDLSSPGSAYHFEFKATVAGDQIPANDTSSTTVFHRNVRDLELVGLDEGATCSDTAFAFIVANVRNNGLGSEHTLELSLSLNGQPAIISSGHVLVAEPDAVSEIILYVEHLNIGVNTLAVSIVDVDGQGVDEVGANNDGTLSFVTDPANTSVTVIFTPDDQPDELRWEIVDAQGTVLYTGGPYLEPFGFNQDFACLATDSCLTMRILDAGNNGMPGGYVSLVIDNVPVFEYTGENFGSSLEIPFCATSACAGFSLDISITQASGQGVNDGVIVAAPVGGVAPYFFTLNGIISQDSATFKNLVPGTYIVSCVDAQGCFTQEVVNIGSVSASEPWHQRRLQVSPNPTIGLAHLQMEATGNESNAWCEVYDVRGNRVQITRMTRWDNTLHGNIALDKFPAGIYTLRVLGLDKVYVGRVVKQ